jgi:hypothetical protein
MICKSIRRALLRMGAMRVRLGSVGLAPCWTMRAENKAPC